MANEWLLPAFALFTADPTIRDRATNSVALTMMPVAPAMRGGIAALAVTPQASDGVQREVRVASQTVDAVGLAASQSQPLTPADLDRFPALGVVDKTAIANRLNATVGNARSADANELVEFSKALIGLKGVEISAADLAKYPSVQRLLQGASDLTGVVAKDEAVMVASPKATAKADGDPAKR
jgi:hypothetical protein